MTKKNRIPFWMYPYSWGMSGKTRETAQAEYELEGYALEKKLLDINSDGLSPDDKARKVLDIEMKYNKITKEKYQRQLVEFIEDADQKALATNELDYKEGKITDTIYQKNQATIKKEPWVTVINMDFTKKSALEGSFELDWNEFFVDKLKGEGYMGLAPDAIVNQWFMEVCKNVAMEEFDGTGDFSANSEANIEAMKRWNSESFPKGRRSYQ